MAVVPGATETGAQAKVLGATEDASTSTTADADRLPADEAAALAAAALPTYAPTTSVPATTIPATTTPAPAVPATVPAPAPLAVGATEHQLSVGGFTRNYLAVVPAPTAKPRSLLIVLHGVNGRGANMRAMGGFEPS